MAADIIAAGGLNSLAPDGNLSLVDYLVDSTGRENPAVCFLPTASSDPARSCLGFYEAFSQAACRPSVLSLFKPPTADLESLLLAQDLVYVGGGNTRSMLALWREWDLPRILRKANGSGIVLAGVSAGAICWFEQGVTDSIPGDLTAMDCLGFLSGSCCPHYDGEANRRPAYHRLQLAGELGPGYAIDDSAALHFQDGVLVRCVCSRPEAGARWVEVASGEIKETPYQSEYLGAQDGGA